MSITDATGRFPGCVCFIRKYPLGMTVPISVPFSAVSTSDRIPVDFSTIPMTFSLFDATGLPLVSCPTVPKASHEIVPVRDPSPAQISSTVFKVSTGPLRFTAVSHPFHVPVNLEESNSGTAFREPTTFSSLASLLRSRLLICLALGIFLYNQEK